MKSFLLSLIILLSQQANQILFAQVNSTETSLQDRVQIQVDELRDLLKLSEEQLDLLKEILIKHATSAQTKRQELSEVPRDSARVVFAKLENEKNNEVKTILTQSQFDEYLKYVEEKRIQRREKFRR